MVGIFTGAGFGLERGSAALLGGAGLLGATSQGRAGENAFVNAATGNLVLQREDEFLVGRGPDSSVGRTYNSLTTLTDDNNDKWRQSTDRRITGLTGTVNTVGSTVKRVSADGTEITYSWSASAAAYLTTDGAGSHDKITYSTSTAEWTWTDGDTRVREIYYGTTASSGLAGYLKSIKDINNNTLTFTYYASSNKLYRATTADSGYTQYNWDANGNISEIVTRYYDTPASTYKTYTRTRYSYETYTQGGVTNYRLSTVTVDLTPENASDTSTYTMSYTYDASNRVTSLSQSDGSSLEVDYSSSTGKVTEIRQLVSTGVTRITQFQYFAGYTLIEDPSGQTTRLDYDADGNLTQVTAPPAYSGSPAQVVQFQYNTTGDVTRMTDALGHETDYVVDSATGLITQVTDRLGNVTSRTYDSGNRLLSETTTGVDASGASVSQTRYLVYTAVGNLKYVVSAEGRVTQYVTATSGGATGAITAEYHYRDNFFITTSQPTESELDTWASTNSLQWSRTRTNYEYDGSNRASLRLTASYETNTSSGGGYTDGDRNIVYYTYDQHGRLIRSSDYQENEAVYVYDGLNRIISAKSSDGETLTYAYSDASSTTQITSDSDGLTVVEVYSKAGELLSRTESGGNIVGGSRSYLHDQLGRVRAVAQDGAFQSYKIYDLAGRLVGDVTGEGYLTEYRYDASNRLVATAHYKNAVSASQLLILADPENSLSIADIRPASDSQDNWSWTVYDHEGRVLQTIAGDGSTTISTYDASGRLQETTAFANKIASATIAGLVASGPTGVVAPTSSAADTEIRFFYDKDGRLLGSMDPSGFIVKNSYDARGLRISQTEFANATTTLNRDTAGFSDLLDGITTSASDRTTRYVYDHRGMIYCEIDAIGKVDVYNYNSAGRLDEYRGLSIPYPDDADATFQNLRNFVSGILGHASYAVRRDNDREFYNYNTQGRQVYSRSQIDNATSGSSSFYGDFRENTYDLRGNLIRSTVFDYEADAGNPFSTSNQASTANSIRSDPDNRVTRYWYNDRDELVYSVDAGGAITRKTWDAQGRLVSETVWDNLVSVSDATTIADLNTMVTGYSRTRSWDYDTLGRVVREYDFGGVNYTAYTYLGATSLVTSITRAAGGSVQEQSTVSNVYDGAGHLLQTTSGAGSTEASTRTFVYDGKGKIVSEEQDVASGDQTTTYTYDLQGRVLTVTDAEGGVTSYEYNGLGDVWKSTDARGKSTYFWYDRLGRVTTTLDAENYLTTTTYTIFGNVDSVTNWQSPVSGTPDPAIEPMPSGTARVTSYTYNKVNQVRSETRSWLDELGQTTVLTSRSYAYNYFTDRTEATNELGLKTTYTYDTLGRLTRESVPVATLNNDAAGATLNGSFNVSTYSYDSRGNVSQKVEGYSLTAGGAVTALRTTNYAYDDLSRLIQITYDAVTALADDLTTTSTETPTETFAYDARGNVIRVTDKAGAQTFSYYDDLDRKIAEIRQLSTSSNVYSSFVYDAVGNLLGTRTYEESITGPIVEGGPPPSPPATGTFRETVFSYDGLNRLTARSVVSSAGNAITTGEWDGTDYVQTTGNLITSYEYDANGNVTAMTAPEGAVTRYWYDGLGRKTDELDGEGYLTHWTYNEQGNVLDETRFATKFVDTPSALTPPTVAVSADDRKTVYTYDGVGHRLTEKRLNVASWTVDSSTGALSASALDYSLIRYTYNALGQVLTKEVGIEEGAAPGFTFKYIYDSSGRLTSEQRQSYVSANGGAAITPTASYNYDALGALMRITQTGQTGTYAASARITNYRYGEGGRLLSTTDAMGNVHTYSYDVAGRLKKDAYERVVNSTTGSDSSATATVAEAKTTLYDLGGRATQTGVYSTVGTTFKLIDFASFQYNVFGEVTQQGAGTNSSSDITTGTLLYQVTNKYDAAGNLVASNSGDGVWKFFSYDKAGNQTGIITSAGTTFTSGMTFASQLASVGASTINGTWTVYDKRGQATQVVEEGRGRSASATSENYTTSRTYNAFGDVVSETDANLNLITYTYNTMGRMIRSESPAVEITAENGASYWVKPSEDYYYDLGGRLVATRDANGTYATTGTSAGTATSKSANTGNLVSYDLLAGTGYEGSQALTSTEFHADGGKRQTLYDIMGDARVLRNELYAYTGMTSANDTLNYTEQTFNALGQLTQVKHNRATDVALTTDDTTRLVDNYVYDLFGQRIQHWNNQYGSSFVEKSGYDALGRVTSLTDMENHVTTITYSWDGTLATSGVGTFGGWSETTGYSDNTMTSTVKNDIFGREVWKSDLGAHVYTTGYDAAGRMTTRTHTGTSVTQTWVWYNTGLLKQSYGNGIEDYTYDKVGNRLTEKQEIGLSTIRDATATYDALGRLKSFSQAATSYQNGASTWTSPDIQISYSYDANGNIRRTLSTRDQLNDAGGIAATDVVDDFWYRYDSMNRLVVDKGQLSGVVGGGSTTVVRGHGSGGVGSLDSRDILYDLAGQRKSVITTQNFTDGFGIDVWWEQRENYEYRGDGTLGAIRITTGTQAGYAPPPAAAATGGALQSSFSYDLMGRKTAQSDYDYTGSSIVHSQSSTFNKIGQITYDSDSTVKLDGKTYTSTNNYSYANGSQYLLGAVYQVTGTTFVTGSSTKNTLTTNSYEWYDSALQSQIDSVADTSAPTKIGRSLFTYDAFGQLVAVNVDVDVTDSGNARDRLVNFVLSGDGQILRRDEADANAVTGDPHELWYRFNGRELSYIGNDGTENQNAGGSIADRRIVGTTGAFRNGQTTGTMYNDTTGGSYEALNTYSQGSAAGGYQVQRAGENLRSIAQQLWGDSSLWYKLAEANGLSADAMLVEGQRLNVPAGVTRTSYNADTLRPYDANDAIGNVSPTTPKPKKKNNCGVFGQILLAAVAIGVTLALRLPVAKLFAQAGLASAAGTGGAVIGTSAIGVGSAAGVAGAAAAGIAGSVVSQGLGVATGIQNKFSFKAVAMAGIGAGVGGTLNIGGITDKFASAAVNGAVRSAVTQGIGVATGLQNKFSWTGVAAAGIGAGVGSFVGSQTQSLGRFGTSLVSNTAGAMAMAATRSAISGGSFGDNLMRSLPDAIGNTIGNLVADQVAGNRKPKAAMPSADELQVSGKVLEVGIEAKQAGGDGSLKLLPSEETHTELLRRLETGQETIPIKVRYLDEAGKEKTRVQDYHIRGTNYDFSSIDAAAFDGIAASWWMREHLQDNFERGGDILSRSVVQADGSSATRYYYNSIETGSPVDARGRPNANLSLNVYSEEGKNGVWVSRQAVAWWHLHPAEDRSDNASFQRSADGANRNFSSHKYGDVDQAKVLAGERVRIPAYLSSPSGQVYRNDHLWDGSRGTVEIDQFGRFNPSDYIDQQRSRRR